MSAVFQRVAILGVGLIGSSIIHAARASGAAESFALYDASESVRARARELGLGDVAESAAEAVANADLVVLSVPVGAMGFAAEAIAPHLKEGAIVTDTGSVKRAVVDAVAKHIPAH